MLATRSTGSAWRSLACARSTRRCTVCHGWRVGRVCVECSTRFAPAVVRCGRGALSVPAGVGICGAGMATPSSFDAAFARVDDDFAWVRLIADFRFHAALDLAPALAQAIVDARPSTTPTLPAVLVPVPVSDAATRSRASAATSGRGSWPGAWRSAPASRPTPACSCASATATRRTRWRWRRIRGPATSAIAIAIAIAIATPPRRIAEVRGRAIAVIDDVMTTGSTLAQIAHVLKQADAARVEARVIARTVRREDD